MMFNDGGWIKLYRGSFDNFLYFKQRFTDWQAWCDLLLLANHKDGYTLKRGVRVIVPRGSVGYSIHELAKRWKWDRRSVVNFIDFLAGNPQKPARNKKTGQNPPQTYPQNQKNYVPQITIQKTNVTALISILNYEKYQSKSATEQFEYTTKRSQNPPQMHTNKNVKESNTVRIEEKKSEKNEKEGNRNISSGERLFVEKYGTKFPKIDYGAKDDNDEPT